MVQENYENWGNQIFDRLEWHILWTEWFDESHAKWDTLVVMIKTVKEFDEEQFVEVSINTTQNFQ